MQSSFSSNLIQLWLVARLAWRNILRHKRRSIVTLSAISLGIWSAISLAALARGVSNQLVEDGISNFLGHIQIHAPGYLDDPSVEKQFEPPTGALLEILNSSLIRSWTPRVRVPAVISSEQESFGITLMGIVPSSELDLSFLGQTEIQGRFLDSETDSGIVIGIKLAEQLKTSIGKRVVITTQGFSPDKNNLVADRGFRVIGLYRAEIENNEKAFGFIGLAIAQEFLKSKPLISEISLTTQLDRDEIDPLLLDLQKTSTNLEIKPWYQIEPMLRALIRLQGSFLYLWFFIVITVICFGLVNTLYMGVLERIKEFGLVQSIGMKPSLIRWLVFWESICLLGIGSCLGTSFSFMTVQLLSGGIDLKEFSSGAQFVGIGSIIYPLILKFDVCIVNLLIFILGLGSSILPAIKASSLSPTEALRSRQ